MSFSFAAAMAALTSAFGSSSAISSAGSPAPTSSATVSASASPVSLERRRTQDRGGGAPAPSRAGRAGATGDACGRGVGNGLKAATAAAHHKNLKKSSISSLPQLIKLAASRTTLSS